MSELRYTDLEEHREALRRHCYRMTGSYSDAEDLVQETLLRGWRGLAGFRGQTTPAAWLYRISTNLCLSFLKGRSRRQMPQELGPTAGALSPGPREMEVSWITPYPTPGPEAEILRDETVRLAFIVALQRLPARQRAVLLLREVLGWSSAQTAEALETSVASVNSALQRARATLAKSKEPLPPSEPRPELLARYVEAWKSLDVDGLVMLLTEDAVLAMPPYREWYQGKEEIAGLMSWAWARPDRGRGVSEMKPILLNGQVSFAHFLDGRPHTLQILDFRGGSVSGITLFHQTELFETFKLTR